MFRYLLPAPSLAGVLGSSVRTRCSSAIDSSHGQTTASRTDRQFGHSRAVLRRRQALCPVCPVLSPYDACGPSQPMERGIGSSSSGAGPAACTVPPALPSPAPADVVAALLCSPLLLGAHPHPPERPSARRPRRSDTFGDAAGICNARFIFFPLITQLGFSFQPSLTHLVVLFLFKVSNANTV